MVTSWSECQRDADAVRETVSSLLAKGGTRDGEVSDTDFGPEWDALFEGGYLFVPSDRHDSGSLAEALAVVEEAGRHAVRGPVAENGILAGWLLDQSNLPVPVEPLTYAPAPRVRMDRGRLTGTVHRVPWAQDVDRIVLLLELPDGPVVASLDPHEATIVAGRNLAGERRDTVVLDGAAALIRELPLPATAEELHARAALTRAALMTGAAARAVELTLQYTKERVQFGRPVIRFQPVQAHLVRAAQHVRAAQVATRSAALAMTFSPDGRSTEAAAAKIVSSHAAGLIAAATHQATGAIGMTKEYELGHLTLRLWSWRDECGSEIFWSRRLGESVLAAGADAIWPLIAGESGGPR